MPEEVDTKDALAHVELVASSEIDPHSQRFSLIRAVRIWPKAAGYGLALTSVILLWGYDMAMVGNLASLPAFRKDYGVLVDDEWIIASEWMSAWNAASPIGIMLGSILGGALQDRKGRRASLAIGCLTSTIGVAVVFSSQYADQSGAARPAIFMVGKFLQGLTIGTAVCAAQTYMSEVLPQALRGPLIAFFPIFFLLGQLISAFIVFAAEDEESSESYRNCIISQWPFSALPLIISVLIPESPAYLVRRGRLEEATKAETRLNKAGANISATIAQLQRAIAHEQLEAQSDKARYLDCFKGIDRRRTLIVILAAVLPQLFGLALLGDGPYFMQMVGQGSSESIIFLIIGIVLGIIGSLVDMWLTTVTGRRKLILTTLLIITLLWLGMGICGSFDTPVVPWYASVTMNLVVLVASLGAWPVSYVVGAETSSLRLRAKSQGIGWAFGGVANFAFSTVSPYTYNPDSGDLGAKVGYIWFGLCIVTFVLAYFHIPETRGRTTYQLDLIFEERTPARKFAQWSGPSVELPITVAEKGATEESA
ncbi:uncharacterized protein Z518_01179 [Rhinocladiella mackenziei CBS 650.93]|uniref:Major facilitator superfamily (MFS) profile domain-containing protein n=1 Tax=Rhinocladiella mackenziei CBS 650.93 TaxID=1442369 RepID=A0A0D2HHH5_9EURO|nr:uncharacterized protein Z518_01179 [Rhinocladiella mackenziei CBS 650.93]KIX10098.1 hypothetical protein Z518_01179 [Rhinocladiella mackenziei CBS 650.93]